MGILYNKKFKKLREEYADLGDVKIQIIEDAAKRYGSSYKDFTENNEVNLFGVKKTTNFDELHLSRSAEYFIRYSALLRAKENVGFAIITGGILTGFGLLIWKCIDVSKNNSTLEAEYQRGRSDTYKDIEDTCLDRGGKDTWIGDASNGLHMILRISDEETDDYREFFALLEKEAEEKAAEDATIIV